MTLLIPLNIVVQGSSSITYGFAADLIHPRRMARGFALLYSSSSFSAAAGPLICGVFGDLYGMESVFYFMVVVLLLVVLLIYFLLARKPAAGSAT